MAAADETRILILYSGGTLGMVRNPHKGYVPYPGFLTETLRTQSRFHDPNADSIFSWSDTTDRYKAWSEAYSRPDSGTTTPQRLSNESSVDKNLDLSTALTSVTGSKLSSHFQSFGKPTRVYSSSPDGIYTKSAVEHHISEDGKRLELMLPTMVTPYLGDGGKKRTRYTVLEYDPLLDSSNMETKDWLRLVADIDLNYQNFDAFIILHGTDTMSYTSSALSMLLENLGKPVVVTGAQVPLSELRNDAIENVLGALVVASTQPIAEVTLFFASTLYRGNRVSKLSNSALSAFDSPNMAPLARAGISIDVAWHLVRRPTKLAPFRAHDALSQDVVLLRLFPGLQSLTVKSFLESSPIRGVVLHSYGAGNAPTRKDLLDVLREATERGVVIVNISQCIQGEVSAIYEVGKTLERVGVVAGADMTPEAALTKLSYLLAKKELGPEQIRRLMGTSLRGELTERRPMREYGAKGANQARRSSSSSSSTTTVPQQRRGKQVLGLLARILGSSRDEQEGSEEGDEDEEGLRSALNNVKDETDLDSLAADAERDILPYLIQRSVEHNDPSSLSSLLDRQASLASVPSTGPISGISGSAEKLATSTTSSNTASTAPNASPDAAHLHLASTLGYTQCVRLLLESGYSVHLRAPSHSSHSPLFLAAYNGHVEVVQLLRSAGAHLLMDERSQAELLQRQQEGGEHGRQGKEMERGDIWALAMGSSAHSS